MSNKAAKIAELFTKTIASTKCFDHNLRKVKIVNFYLYLIKNVVKNKLFWFILFFMSFLLMTY